jgi:phenylacetate-coenzyme A ligase PaaK-like adenylate-forming protein
VNPARPLTARLERDFADAEARRRVLAARAPAQTDEQQLAAIQAVWADAVGDVPYYAELVASGRAPRELRTWTDVRALPELSRQALQDHPESFVRRSGPPDSHVKTGGSTAAPLQIGMNHSERRLMRIVKLAAWQALGYERSSRLFLIWGHSHMLGTGWRGRVRHAQRKLTDVVLGYRRVDAYRLSPEIARAYADDIVRFSPTGVIGYAAALDLFARYAQADRARLRSLGVAFVLSTAEAPPRPDSVALIEDLFGCPLVQEYGGAEFGQVAFKHGDAPFEVYSDLVFLENAASGAIVTTLYPRYTPLVRYRTGDALTGERLLPHGHVGRFEAVAGRINDMVTLADGQSIHSVAILHCIHQEAVHNIQVIFADDGIDVALVAAAGDHPAMEARIRRRLSQVHPALAAARFRYVEDLHTTAAGKRRWCIDRRSVIPE